MTDFGEWIDEHSMSMDADVRGLFTDSYRCFTNNITRPAYLLAYQGMMQYVRMTILQSLCRPSGFSEAEWESNWLAPLRDDRKWDELAFKCTQQGENTVSGKAAVMNIHQEVREKFPFWRQLRNVCAHYKGYDLNKAHTLALYSFIEQYLLTFTIEGSQMSLNRLFDDYYNPMLTSVHEDIKPLLLKIDTAVHDDEFNNFFDEVRKSCRRHAKFTSRFHDFIHQAIYCCPKRVRDALRKYVQADMDYRDEYLDHYPQDSLEVLCGTENIHQFWYARLPHRRSKLTILALLLQAGLIPDADKEEAMRRCMQHAEEYSSLTNYSIDKELVGILADKGYFNLFIKLYFNSDNTSRNAQSICYKTDFYIGMISIMPWDKKYVESLIGVFSKDYYPYTLQSRLQEMYQKDAEYKKAIDKICADEGWTLPDSIV